MPCAVRVPLTQGRQLTGNSFCFTSRIVTFAWATRTLNSDRNWADDTSC